MKTVSRVKVGPSSWNVRSSSSACRGGLPGICSPGHAWPPSYGAPSGFGLPVDMEDVVMLHSIISLPLDVFL